MIERATGTAKYGAIWAAFALSHLARYLPKREGLWVFGAGGGGRFGENTKYLYLHAANEHPDVRPVWLSDDSAVVEALRASGYEAYDASGPRGLYYTLQAELLFVSLGTGDVAWWATGGTETVQLWHGLPLKRIGHTRRGKEWSRIDDLIFRYRESSWDYLTVTADSLRSVFADAYRLDDDQILTTGYPRNDALLREVPDETLGVDDDVHERIRDLSAESTVAAYMPTYRRGFGEEHGDDIGDAALDFDRLDELLAAEDAYLLLKYHPHARATVEPAEHDRIVLLPDDYDVYPSLADVDVLVTDYSSVYFDYLLLDRPVVFYPYDLDRYAESPGFYFEYEAVTPGPKPRTPEALYDELAAALRGEDDYEAERERVRERFFDRADAGSAERVYEAFADRP